MDKFTILGPGRSCDEITAADLEQGIAKASRKHPGKDIAADATEVLYVCESGEDPSVCQKRLR